MYYSTLFSVCQGFFGDFSEKNAAPDTVVRVLGAGGRIKYTDCKPNRSSVPCGRIKA
jgi:hypothetical protein